MHVEESFRKQAKVDDQMCVMELLDTGTIVCNLFLMVSAGQEEYAALRDQFYFYCFFVFMALRYYHKGQGFILVYAITQLSTFEKIEALRAGILKVLPWLSFVFKCSRLKLHLIVQ